MDKFILLTSMFFCHIIDDFYLQGILAQLKQHKFWEENAPQKLYQYDYIIALLIHSFSWCFMIFTPLFIWSYCYNIDCPLFVLILSFIANIFIHAIVDNLKANKLKINLITDQIIHFIQIIITFLIFTQI